MAVTRFQTRQGVKVLAFGLAGFQDAIIERWGATYYLAEWMNLELSLSRLSEIGTLRSTRCDSFFNHIKIFPLRPMGWLKKFQVRSRVVLLLNR